MNTNRKTAILVGVLYIIGTAAGILSVVFTQSSLNAPDYLGKISANENQIRIGALFILTMGVALALIPAAMFPILKKHHEGLAVGYIIFRGALETVCYIVLTISWLLLIAASQDYVRAGAPDASYHQTLGALVLSGHDAASSMLEIVFPMGALMFYTVLYQSKLMPRWISGWGLFAASLSLGMGVLGVFHLIEGFSTTQVVLSLPIFLQEMVMAVWLIVKGFNPAAIATELDQANLN